MLCNHQNYRTIWVHPEHSDVVQVIDQRLLPFRFECVDLHTAEEAFGAIRDMTVRGAPLIGITGGYGLALSLRESQDTFWKEKLVKTAHYLKTARPTAVNLAVIIDEMLPALLSCTTQEEATKSAFALAAQLADREVKWSEAIGEYGLGLIEAISKQKNGEPVHILTHCNAGWLACIDWGTATAPIYKAHRKGIPIHVWVDETRPRNQGARLTAWELSEEGVPHTIIPDNTGGHLMQHRMVDLCIVGSDRTTRTGDVANKIGTYLKALAAYDNQIPFYVALPSSSIDFSLTDGISQIPIEQRDPTEVTHVEGIIGEETVTTQITNPRSEVANYGFDVTPARLVTGLITERGICAANQEAISDLFPEQERLSNKH